MGLEMSARDYGTIVQIGDVLVSEDVFTEYFSCNYEECKGRCCVEGDSGAPLGEDELEGLERGYGKYSALMGDGGRASVAANGFFCLDRDGDLVTPLVDGSCECAFCHRLPDGALLCSIERAGLDKPVSCRLYPIRQTPLSGGGIALNVHKWDICRGAFEKGRREGIKVYQFLRKPLTQRFGKEFYNALETAAQHLDSIREDE